MSDPKRLTADERKSLADYTDTYTRARTEVLDAIEQQVIGAVWGVTGYTTRAQADLLARRLQLLPGHLLLDVGSGRGWPGLYLAQQTGCAVICTDLPWDGLRQARERAATEGLIQRSGFAVASGADQPFRPRSFDAVVHTDVLC